MSTQNVARLLCVTDEDGNQAVYLSGHLEASDSSIYPADIADVLAKVGVRVVEFRHACVAWQDDGWPTWAPDTWWEGAA